MTPSPKMSMGEGGEGWHSAEQWGYQTATPNPSWRERPGVTREFWTGVLVALLITGGVVVWLVVGKF